jgi:UDP-N-acetylmuramoyl-tripeptide--D-alanyl-D-alanine ligase
MAEFILAEVCQATQGRVDVFDAHTIFSGVSTDTRHVQPGDVFIALIGERFDGHDFLQQAVEKGASGVIVSREGVTLSGIPVIHVDNTRKALQDLAAFHRRRFHLPVIAITGSNGKTTTKDMTAAVLASRFHVLKTEANFNNEIGLPLTLLKITEQHQAVVVEMGMRGKGEIRELACIAKPNIGMVTNVGETHIERLGSLEAIADAKAELVETVEADGLVILNNDNDYVKAMGERTPARTVFYGMGEESDIWAEQIASGSEGIQFTCRTEKFAFPVTLSVPGRHNVYNALAAIAAGLELGLLPDEIIAGLKQFTGGTMRLQIEQYGQYTVINDAYNASPLSMAAAIDTLADVTRQRKIAVFGDMLELGDFAEQTHRAIGQKLAEQKIDAVITVGTLAAFIADAAGRGGVAVTCSCKDHEEAKVKLAQILKPGDTILIKGSRGVKMEKMLELFK